MTFDEAVKLMRSGHGVIRRGWGDQLQSIQLRPSRANGTPEFVAVRVQETGWTAFAADVLADDWEEK